MQSFPPPSISAGDTYLQCAESIANAVSKARYVSFRPAVDQNEAIYSQNGARGTLFTLQRVTSENPNIIGDLSNSEMKELYSYRMLKKLPGRSVYNKLLNQHAHRKCPYCGGIGQIETLDHYLPKGAYSYFSVTPLNLVPCCRSCNTGKLNGIASTFREQNLHPYFDDPCYFDQQWIYGRLDQRNTWSVEFYVNPPAHWHLDCQARTRAHFDNFELGRKYAVEAGQEITTVISQRRTFFRDVTTAEFREHLHSVMNSPAHFVNHWKRVLYQSLAADDQFINSI